MSAHLQSCGARDGPITRIYGDRPANDEASKMAGLKEVVCAGTLSIRNVTLIVPARIGFLNRQTIRWASSFPGWRLPGWVYRVPRWDADAQTFLGLKNETKKYMRIKKANNHAWSTRAVEEVTSYHEASSVVGFIHMNIQNSLCPVVFVFFR